MLGPSPSCHTFIVHKLRTRSELSVADVAAVEALPCHVRTVESGSYLVREGDPPELCAMLMTGFAFRQKTTQDGGRQILSFHVPGDLLDLPSLFLKVADHSVQTLVRCEVAFVPVPALQELVLAHPGIARAMWVDALVDGSIFREWELNLGRRDARGRIAHILCELASRMEAAGLIESKDEFELPITQEQFADAAGLTPVHINRTLQALKAEGLIGRAGRSGRIVTVPDWDKLRAAADFNSRYLHLEQAVPA